MAGTRFEKGFMGELPSGGRIRTSNLGHLKVQQWDAEYAGFLDLDLINGAGHSDEVIDEEIAVTAIVGHNKHIISVPRVEWMSNFARFSCMTQCCSEQEYRRASDIDPECPAPSPNFYF